MKRILAALAAAAAVTACEGSDVTRMRNSEEVVVRGHKLSLHGVDGPDRNATCAPEQQAAAAAEARIAELLASGTVDFRKTGMACLQFMMCDAFVTVDGADLSETLIAEGHAVQKMSAPGAPPFDWCQPAPLVSDQAGPEESLELQPTRPEGAAQPNTEDTLQSATDQPAPNETPDVSTEPAEPQPE